VADCCLLKLGLCMALLVRVRAKLWANQRRMVREGGEIL
jgi:hypothetical protein